MNILVVISILVVTILLLAKGAKRSQSETPTKQSAMPRILIGFYVASQTVIMFLLFVYRGSGKSLSNAAFQIIIVLGIVVVGSIICLMLYHKRAKALSWILLFSIASAINVMIWEITKALPE